MIIKVLGSGPSTRVKGKGKSARLQSSALVEVKGKHILIDVSQDFNKQISEKDKIDFILFTHGHSDAVGGISQLKDWMKRKGIERIPAFTSKIAWDRIRDDFKNLDHLDRYIIEAYHSFEVDGIKITPIEVNHEFRDKFKPVFAYKIGDFIYAEDFESIPEKSLQYFGGVNVALLDAAMWNRKIIGHMEAHETVRFAAKFNIKHPILTQMGVLLPEYFKAKAELQKLANELNPKMKLDLAYDGMIIDTSKFEEILVQKLEGIYLVPPHAKWIYEGKKKAIVKSKNFKNKIGQDLYLLSKEFAYGIIKLKESKEISLKEFDDLRSEHLISEEERLAWWPSKKVLYYYPIGVVKLFEEPRRYNWQEGIQTFYSDVKFLNRVELIEDIIDYDPSKIDTKVLQDDWRIVSAWYSSKKQGKEIKYSIETIINLAKLIFMELKKRDIKFHPDEMKPYSKQLYNIVQKSIAPVTEHAEKFGVLKDCIIIKDFVSLIGSMADGKEFPNDADIHIRMNTDIMGYLKRAVYARISKQMEWLNDLHIVCGDAEGAHDSFYPLYDLVLKRSLPFHKVEMSTTLIPLHGFLPMKPKRRFYKPEEAAEFVFTKGKKFALERKYNGFRALLHKQGDEVKVFSDQGRDITFPFPTIVEQVKKLAPESFILDGELIPYDAQGNPLGRAELAKYIGAVASKKDVDDSRVKVHCFDVLYYSEDIHQKPWFERKAILNKFKWQRNITGTKSLVVKNKDDAIRAMKFFGDLKGSEGAIIKSYDAPYTIGKETDAWIKYRILIPVKLLVLKVNKVEDGGWNYSVGFELGNVKRINPKYVIDFKGKKIHPLGNTFNTKLKAEEGDILSVLIEEVWRHKSDETIRYSIHKPSVVDKTTGPTTSQEAMDNYVVARGVEVEEAEEVVAEELDKEGGEVMVKNFPDRMQSAFRKVMEEKKWLPFVMQAHLRGKSLHYDLRHQVDDHLEGYTLFGRSTTDPLNVRTQKGDIRGTIKLFQPLDWLKARGVGKPGGPGSTKKYPAVFIILSKGSYTIHEVDDHKIVFEYKSDSGRIDKSSLKAAAEKGLPTYDPGDDLINMGGSWSLHIAHIRPEEWIILLDKLK